MTVSEMVVQALFRKKLTQIELAKKMDKDAQTISNKLKNDSWTRVEIIALNHILELGLDEAVLTK